MLEYQLELGRYIWVTPFCACWVPMGFGKTVSTLTAYAAARRRDSRNRALVIAPKRVARKVWSDEINNWSHLSGLTVQKIIGTVDQRWKALNTDADIHTINREQVEWLMVQFIQGEGKKFKQFRKWPWNWIIIDEAQSFMSPDSYRFKALRTIRRIPSIERIVELTGTPVPNGYHNLWSQVFLLDQGKRLEATEDAYLKRYFHLNNGYEYGYRLKGGAQKQIQEKIADIVISIPENVIERPDVAYNDIKVELKPKDLAVYKKMERELLTELKGRTITAVNAGVCCGKLLQMANGAVYYEDRQWEHFHDEKIEALLETLEGCKPPVMIPYGFKHDLFRLKVALELFCGKKRTWRLLDTEQDEDGWNAGKIDYLLIHPASAGHGLNLQHSRSEAVVWFGLTPNLEWYQQLNARLIGGHRGLGRKVVVHRIVAEDTYDLRVCELLEEKDYTQEDLKLALVSSAFRY